MAVIPTEQELKMYLCEHFGVAKMHTPKYRLNDTPTDRETD